MDLISGSARKDFSHIPAEAIKELHRQGELCLHGTIQLAIAADHRATTLTGIMGAGSTALVAGALTRISSAHPDWALVCAGASAAVLLFIGSSFCAFASRPSNFFVAGYEPKRLAATAKDETWILRYATEDVQIRIDSNRAALVRASRLVTIGMLIALFAIPFGVIMFFSISSSASHQFFGMEHLVPAAGVGAHVVGELAAMAAAPAEARSALLAD